MSVVMRCGSNSIAELGQRQSAEMTNFSVLKAYQIAPSPPDCADTDAPGDIQPGQEIGGTPPGGEFENDVRETEL
jgi:hypothetical protein